MIKTVHIVTKLELGGAQLNTIFTFEHLNRDIFEVYLFSGANGVLTDKVRKDADEKNFSYTVIKDLVREIKPVKDVRAFFELKKRLKEISPDIVHTHSSKAGIIGRLASFFADRAIIRIHSVHGFPFSRNQFFIKRMIYTLIEKAGSFFTDHFIFVSEYDAEVARDENIIKVNKDNFTLVRSGFELSRFGNGRRNNDVLRKKYGIGKDQLVVGIIAPFKPQKGLFHLIEIAERVINKEKNVIFFIAGDGELRSEIEERLKAKQIGRHFRLPGFIFEIEKIIPFFDIGVSTSLWEGLPQSLIQLRLCKKPVVASNIPGNSEIIKEGKNGFLEDPTKYNEFAGKIIELLKDKELRQSLSAFKEDFHEWDGDYMVRKQEELYLNLISRR